MSPKPLQLLPGALLVADAHFSDRRPELLAFLKSVASGEIAASQMILMGDIFDLLFGPIPLTRKRNAEAVAVIREIAERMEVIYLEGNHDFQIGSLFPGIAVYPLAAQPVAATWEGQKVWLAHGDWGNTFGYHLYTAIIRSRPVLYTLRLIDSLTGHSIIRWLDRYLHPKEDCGGAWAFEAYIRRRFEGFDTGGAAWFIEGHFHQNRGFPVGEMHYVNLPAFACNQRYFELQSIQDQEPLKEAAYLEKEP
jgi:UDP-2,3-diacylglucosamine hydrolase